MLIWCSVREIAMVVLMYDVKSLTRTMSVLFVCIQWEKNNLSIPVLSMTCSLTEFIPSSHILRACIVQHYSFDRFDKGLHLGSDFSQWWAGPRQLPAPLVSHLDPVG